MKLDDIRNLDMNNAGGWPMPLKVGACVLVILLIPTIGYFVSFKGQQEQVKSLKTQEESLLMTFASKQAKAANLEAYRQQLADMEIVLQNLLRQLPGKTEMADLLVDISQTALSTGIDTELFEPQTEVPREFYAEQPIRLRMKGTYHQFGQFVSGVASLPRVVILTMHDIQLRSEQVAAGRLVLEGTVRTYRYLDDEEAAAAGSTP